MPFAPFTQTTPAMFGPPRHAAAAPSGLGGFTLDPSQIADKVVSAFMPALRREAPSLVSAMMPAFEAQLPGVVERSAPAMVDAFVPIVQKKVPVLIDAAWPPVQQRMRAELARTIKDNVPFSSLATKYGPAITLAIASVVVGASALTLYRAARDGI